MEVEYDGMMKPEEETVTPREKTNSASGGASHNHYSKSKSNSDRRMVDITRDKPIKVAVRVVVPVRDHPKFNFVGKLLGPKGNSLKRLQEDTMCKMAVLGRGSMKDRHKEEELRASGDPKFQHLSEELHVEISAFATPAEAHARIAYALAEVRRFLVPDYNDDIRQEQMWEMQVLSTQKNAKDGGGSNGGMGSDGGIVQGSGPGSTGGSPAGSAGGECPSTGSEDSLNEGGDSPSALTATEHPALRGIQQVGGAGSPPSSTTSVAASSTAAVTGTGVVGRKRPLLAGGPRTSMTPTKRTVMSLLARARAAQAKQLPATFQRAPENMVADSFSITGTDTSVASISNFPRATTLVPLLREDYLTGAVNLNLI